jgi:hypothetical protein
MRREEPKRTETQVITRHVPHDQEVNHFNHNYSVGLDDIPVLNVPRLRNAALYESNYQLFPVEGTLTYRSTYLNAFSKDYHREQLLEKLKQIPRASSSWKEVKYTFICIA